MKNNNAWILSHPKYRISVWVEEDQKTHYPSIYTIDALNKFVAFEEMGKHYHEPLEHVNAKEK